MTIIIIMAIIIIIRSGLAYILAMRKSREPRYFKAVAPPALVVKDRSNGLGRPPAQTTSLVEGLS